ncbi:hypothetical protein KUTeg_020403 [Tegillarca granosa]|uniref:VWFA domain-containing protein n=1 Tax=Tegillarca granosa TaxID=220873 RepID=A0ABQ9E7S4_TEGGR|nr:hypothetical protein KUTeg_020403 [Tegillarca granosa]
MHHPGNVKMPGIKRKASAVAPYQSPIKLKKQSTSVAVNRAISTLKKAKSAPKSPVKLLKAASLSPRKKSPQKTLKKPLPLPRFPTLKPTKPIDPDALPPKLFYGNTPTTSFTKLKKAPTLLLEGDSTTSATKHLSKKSSIKKLSVKPLSKKKTTKGKSDSNNSSKNSNSEGTITSSGMNSSLRKLASGSFIGKIIKDDGLGDLLPNDTSLAVYEFSEETVASPSINLSKTSNTPAVRQSVFDVANFFASASPSKDSENGKDTDNKNNENSSSIESNSSESQNSSSSLNTSIMSVDSDLNPIRSTDSPLKEGENGNKSPKKGLRGGVREIVFSFDTTGSMYSYMEETRDKIKEIVNKLQTDVPGIKLGFLAHGDYYDLQFDRYLIKWINFGASVDEISDFFEDLGITHGGDPEECYELVLRRVQDPNYVAWTPGSQRCLVMIGDSDPHEPGYTFEGKVNEIDWRQETEKLKEMGVRIYGLQVGYGSDFYRQISKTTGGAHLRLDSASLMPDVITAICLREGNLKLLKHYESEVRSRAKKEGNSVDLELERLFSAVEKHRG